MKKRTVWCLLPLVLALGGSIAQADLTIPFTVWKDSRVSLAVYDQEGRLVRTLLTGKPLA